MEAGREVVQYLTHIGYSHVEMKDNLEEASNKNQVKEVPMQLADDQMMDGGDVNRISDAGECTWKPSDDRNIVLWIEQSPHDPFWNVKHC